MLTVILKHGDIILNNTNINNTNINIISPWLKKL